MPSLYVTSQGARVEREYNRLVVADRNELLLDVPAVKVSDVVLVGRVGVTTPALQMMLEREIGLVLLNQRGEFLGRLSGGGHANVSLRRAQYIRSQEANFKLEFSRAVTLGKLWNCRVRCMRIGSDTGNEEARKAARKIERLLADLACANDVPGVRTIEAQGSRAYFAALRSHLSPDWAFPARKRRPPPDPVNVLLSICYTLLTQAVHSAIDIAGLDPFCGFYHAEKWGRPALALDLMEEFRPLIADSVVITLTKNRFLSPADFQEGTPEHPVRLPLDKYAVVLRVFGQRLRTKVTIPGLKRRTTYHRLLEYQARRLAAVVEGKEKEYRPFRSR
jgi:CRISPR-associated protein Cas1